MKKVTSSLLAGLMTVALLSGCGSAAASTTQTASSQADAESTGTTATATGDVEIWYYWERESHQAALDKVITDYNASQSDITVTAKYVPFADFKKQLSIGVTADELPDMVILDSPDHASYASMGIFADLTGLVDTSSYYDGPIASCTLDGKLYGVPFGSNCLSLYYNVDMLNAAGVSVPTTWDELKTAAAALTSGKVTGLAFCSVQNEEGTFNFMPWVWSTGASSFEIGTENGIKALSFVQSLVNDGSMSKECINWTQGDVMNQFISGNVAMMVNGPWQVATIRSEAPNLKWDVTLIPKDTEYASVLGGENYAVIEGGNKEAALAFLDYATQAEQVKYMMDAFGYIAARSDIAGAQFADDPIMQKFVEQMKYAKPRGPHKEWPSISDAISLAFNEVMTNSKTPQDAAAQAQATIDSIIG